MAPDPISVAIAGPQLPGRPPPPPSDPRDGMRKRKRTAQAAPTAPLRAPGGGQGLQPSVVAVLWAWYALLS